MRYTYVGIDARQFTYQFLGELFRVRNIWRVTWKAVNRNGGTVAYMRPHINFTRELLASSARVRDNIGVFSIKIIGRSQRTSRAYQIVRPILSVGSSVRFLKDSFDRIVLSRSDY